MILDYVQCKKCRKENSRRDYFQDLSLVIQPFGIDSFGKDIFIANNFISDFLGTTEKNSSVDQAIKNYLKAEVLNGDNMYACENCKEKTPAIKG